jgi:uncharacterized membrane protein YccC
MTNWRSHVYVSLVLIFVCLFCGFYLVKVAYALMIFWITTMLALLYGLLGQFGVGVLLLRLEETAIGAVIGVAVAVLVLPTSTKATVREDAHTFLTTLVGRGTRASWYSKPDVHPGHRRRRHHDGQLTPKPGPRLRRAGHVP